MKKIKNSPAMMVEFIEHTEMVIKSLIKLHWSHLGYLNRLKMEWKRKAAQEKNTTAQVRAQEVVRGN